MADFSAVRQLSATKVWQEFRILNGVNPPFINMNMLYAMYMHLSIADVNFNEPWLVFKYILAGDYGALLIDARQSKKVVSR
jgi:hypothetical protein